MVVQSLTASVEGVANDRVALPWERREADGLADAARRVLVADSMMALIDSKVKMQDADQQTDRQTNLSILSG